MIKIAFDSSLFDRFVVFFYYSPLLSLPLPLPWPLSFVALAAVVVAVFFLFAWKMLMRLHCIFSRTWFYQFKCKSQVARYGNKRLYYVSMIYKKKRCLKSWPSTKWRYTLINFVLESLYFAVRSFAMSILKITIEMTTHFPFKWQIYLRFQQIECEIKQKENKNGFMYIYNKAARNGCQRPWQLFSSFEKQRERNIKDELSEVSKLEKSIDRFTICR